MTPYQAALGFARCDVLKALLKKRRSFISAEVLAEVNKCAKELVKCGREEYMQRGEIMAIEWNKLDGADAEAETQGSCLVYPVSTSYHRG